MRSDLTKHVFVMTRQHDVGLLIDSHVDAGGKNKLDRMRVAKCKRRNVALDIDTVADTDDIAVSYTHLTLPTNREV